MADEIRPQNQPSRQTNAAELVDLSTRGALAAIAVAALVIALILGIAVFRGNLVSNAPKKDQYQAVFLTNGQVYFGKLSNVGANYVLLDQVYYIQSNQNNPQASSSPQPNLTLVKLGDELHGPERQMQIASNQIVFWENLKSNSKVVDAIKKQSSNNNQ